MNYYSALSNSIVVAICQEVDYIAIISNGVLTSSPSSQESLLRVLIADEGKKISKSSFEALFRVPNDQYSAKALYEYFKVIKHIEENGTNN